jgi:hypothetical protein
LRWFAWQLVRLALQWQLATQKAGAIFQEKFI